MEQGHRKWQHEGVFCFLKLCSYENVCGKIRQQDTSLRSSEQVFVQAVPGEAAWLQCGETAPTCEDQI